MMLAFGLVGITLLIIVIVLWKTSVNVAAKEAPMMRACPICGHELKIGENILAERTGVAREGRERIMIKGCGYCLKK